MSKLLCPCGHEISDVMWPNDHVGSLITQWQLEDCRQMPLAEIVKSRAVWECEKCGRLAIDFPNAHDETVKWYSPDDGKAGNLMLPPQRRSGDA